MAGIRIAGPAEDLLLVEDLPVAGAVSRGEADLSAAEALREADDCETAFHARGAQSHRRRDRRDRAKHCGRPARRGDSRHQRRVGLFECFIS